MMNEGGRSFIKNFVGFSLVTWISFALSFLTAPISTRLFEPDVLGKINIFNTYLNLFGILVLLGLDQAYVRFYYERPLNKSVHYLFTFCIAITYAIIFLCFVITIPFQDDLSELLFQEGDNLLLYLFGISVFTTATLRYLNLTYRMEKNIKLYTIQGVLIVLVSKVLYIGVGFWDPTYKPALIVLTSSQLLLCVVFILIQSGRFEKLKTIERAFVNKIFCYSIPLIPVSILVWVNASIPQIMMQKYMDYYSIGIFVSALHLANLILVIQSGFNTFWVPYTYENYKTQTGQFFKVHRYLLCALTLFSLIIVLSQDVIFLVLGEKYRAAKTFFPFLILSPVCYIIGETTGIGISISRKTYLNLFVFIGSVIVNIIMCYLLHPIYGILGIAISVAFASIVAMCLKSYFGEINYKVIESYRYICYTVIAVIISAIITAIDLTLEIRFLLLVSLLITSIYFFRIEVVELSKYLYSFIKK